MDRSLKDFEVSLLAELKTYLGRGDYKRLSAQPDLVDRLVRITDCISPQGAWGNHRALNRAGRFISASVADKKGALLATGLANVRRRFLDPDIATWLPFVANSKPAVQKAGGMGAVLRALAEVQKLLVEGAARAKGRGPGRPLDPWQEKTATAVARALVRVGEPVKKGRDGLFATVLRAVFTVAEPERLPPEDFFRLLKRCADSVAGAASPRQ